MGASKSKYCAQKMSVLNINWISIVSFFYIKKILIYNFLPGKRCITGSSLNNQDEQELQIHFDMAPRAREYGFFC